jgi:hypothetical protein
MSRQFVPKVDHPYVFSVSQVETFALCNRKWAFEKIDKLKRPSSPAAVLGQEVHADIEKYLLTGKPIDRSSKTGKIIFPGLKYLPFPKTKGMSVEKWFVIKFGVAAYRGLKDISFEKIGRPRILDNKTTRNFKWKKTKEELRKNKQAGIYSAHSMALAKADTVDCEWVYFKTEGKPCADTVKVEMHKTQVEDILTDINNIAEEMVHTIRTCKKAMDVEPNYTACEAFGGCPFKDKCKPNGSKILRSIMSQKREESLRDSTSVFLEDLRNRNNQKKTAKERAENKIKIKDVEVIPVNPPERETVKRPRPPAAKEVNGEWESPVWDDVEFQWFFPSEQKEAKKKKLVEDIEKEKDSVTTKKNKKSKKFEDVEDLDSEDEEDEEELPKKSKKKKTSDEDDEDEDDLPKKSKKKKSSDDDDEDEEDPPKKSKKKKASDEDDEDEEDLPKKSKKKSSSDEEDDEEDPPKKSKKKKASDEDEDEDEEEDLPKKSKKKKSSDDDEDNELVVRIKKSDFDAIKTALLETIQLLKKISNIL